MLLRNQSEQIIGRVYPRPSASKRKRFRADLWFSRGLTRGFPTRRAANDWLILMSKKVPRK